MPDKEERDHLLSHRFQNASIISIMEIRLLRLNRFWIDLGRSLPRGSDPYFSTPLCRFKSKAMLIILDAVDSDCAINH